MSPPGQHLHSRCFHSGNGLVGWVWVTGHGLSFILCVCAQPLRAVSIKAATEDVQVANNGAVGAAAAANMLDFEELSDIVRFV